MNNHMMNDRLPIQEVERLFEISQRRSDARRIQQVNRNEERPLRLAFIVGILIFIATFGYALIAFIAYSIL